MYRPIRLMTRPEMIDEAMMPTIIGSISSPDRVGVAPLTICRYSGT